MTGKKQSCIDEIDHLMRNYFSTEAQLEKWYDTKSRYFYAFNKGQLTPREMIELGREEDVLKFIKIHLERT